MNLYLETLEGIVEGAGARPGNLEPRMSLVFRMSMRRPEGAPAVLRVEVVLLVVRRRVRVVRPVVVAGPGRRPRGRGRGSEAGEAVDLAAVAVAVAVVAVVATAVAAVEGVAWAELDVLSVAVEEGVHRVDRRVDVEVLGRVRDARRVRGVRRRRRRRSGWARLNHIPALNGMRVGAHYDLSGTMSKFARCPI